MTRALRHELKLTRPFPRPEVGAYVGLVLTAEALRSRCVEFFKTHGLSDAQFNVLRILRGAGQPLPCAEVGARMLSRLPDITRLVDRLVDAGLVTRKRCDEDRRVVYIDICRKGRTLVDSLDEPLLELHRSLLGHLTRKELSQLGSLLDRAREKVTRTESTLTTETAS